MYSCSGKLDWPAIRKEIVRADDPRGGRYSQRDSLSGFEVGSDALQLAVFANTMPGRPMDYGAKPWTVPPCMALVPLLGSHGIPVLPSSAEGIYRYLHN